LGAADFQTVGGMGTASLILFNGISASSFSTAACARETIAASWTPMRLHRFDVNKFNGAGFESDTCRIFGKIGLDLRNTRSFRFQQGDNLVCSKLVRNKRFSQIIGHAAARHFSGRLAWHFAVQCH